MIIFKLEQKVLELEGLVISNQNVDSTAMTEHICKKIDSKPMAFLPILMSQIRELEEKTEKMDAKVSLLQHQK